MRRLSGKSEEQYMFETLMKEDWSFIICDNMRQTRSTAQVQERYNVKESPRGRVVLIRLRGSGEHGKLKPGAQ